MATYSNVIGTAFVRGKSISTYIGSMNIHILVFSLLCPCCWCLWIQDISRRCVLFLWIIVRQISLGSYISLFLHFTYHISLFDYNRPTWIQTVIAEPIELISICNGRRPYAYSTRNIILTFLSKWHFAWKRKYGSLP